jgi:hypothetical protein
MHRSLRKQFAFIRQLHPGKRIIRAAGSSPLIQQVGIEGRTASAQTLTKRRSLPRPQR